MNFCAGTPVAVAAVPADCARGLRLCQLTVSPDSRSEDASGESDGYGFTLYTELKTGGQFLGDVERQSPAERAGLLSGDRLIEVNGVNVETDSHVEVWYSKNSTLL